MQRRHRIAILRKTDEQREFISRVVKILPLSLRKTRDRIASLLAVWMAIKFSGVTISSENQFI
ncbi:hypothetical protein DDI_0851 [Dickeya dianthicola RNS04.9]|nr:hypothetical protein DDI_0851 [Dickeya dianthicola RNS04.9]